MIGGGSLPGESLPTTLLALKMEKPDKFLKMLREQHLPIIARIENERVLFDPRTILSHQESSFLETLKHVVEEWN